MGECERTDVERLVLAAKAGEAWAFEALAARFRHTALLIARSVCDDADLAQDAVQDSFLTAFRALGGLDDPGRFAPWFATVVRNRTRRLAQDGYRLRSRSIHAVDEGLLAMAPSLGADLPEAGEAAVRDLPCGIRESMRLYYFGDWSVGEIAAMLDRPVTTVKWQLHAGRALLRKRLALPESRP